MKHLRLSLLFLTIAACQHTEKVREAQVTYSESNGQEYVAPQADTTASVQEAPKEDMLTLYVKDIISGKRKPETAYLSQACLKELLNENPEKRNFYFEAYKVMLNSLDERLTELPAAPVVAYFRKYPAEAMNHYHTLSVKEKDQFVSHLAYDFWVEGNCHNTIPAWINEVLIENPSIKANEQDYLTLGRLMVQTYK